MGIYCAHFNFSKKGAKKKHLMCKQVSGLREEGRRDWETRATNALFIHVTSRFSELSLALQKGVCD